MKTNFIDVKIKYFNDFIISKLVNFGEDCPVLDRLYDYCLTYTSGSVGIY